MNVFLATPCYDGRVVPAFETSLKASLLALKEAGIPVHWEALSGCCYLPIARNKLVKKFLESDATDFIFIDSDIEWTPEALFKLLSHPVELVGAAYRHKTWEETYPIWLKTTSDGTPIQAGLSNLLECWSIPTGFMRITRSVFDAMIKLYGEALEVDEYAQDGKFLGTFLNFFDTVKVGRQWQGEDCRFCFNWTMDMQRQLFVDPTIHLNHWGTSQLGEDEPFKGNYHHYLSRQPGGANDPGYYGTDIEGYMVLIEAQWLYLAAKEMGSIVEIGSYFGKSSHALLSGCPGNVTCVDLWSALDWKENDTPEMAQARFEKFVENTNQFWNRSIKRANSLDAVKDFADKSVDMVFIDGDHSYQAVKDDIAAWLPKARKLICGHDYNFYGWPDVKKAVDEIFGERVKTCGTIWYVELEQ